MLSCVYELWRATAKRGTSRHDSMEAFVKNNVVFYAIAGVVVALLLFASSWARWVGLAFSVGSVAASVLYYNPKIMIERAPGAIDWFEDLVFTGLLVVAAAFLAYSVAGVSLTS